MDAIDFSDDPSFVILNDVLVKHVTEKAALIEVDGSEHWIPLSVLRDKTVAADRHTLQDVEVMEWFCRKEEII